MTLGSFALQKPQSYVTNPSTQTAVDARDTVNSRYTDVTTYIASAEVQLTDAITQLKAAVGTITSNDVAASGLSVSDFVIPVSDFTVMLLNEILSNISDISACCFSISICLLYERGGNIT